MGVNQFQKYAKSSGTHQVEETLLNFFIYLYID